MEKNPTSPPILSPEDLIRSLVRSPAYLEDYKAHEALLAKWEIEQPSDHSGAAVLVVNGHMTIRVFTMFVRVGLAHRGLAQALKEGRDFLRRWPLLLHPVPPHRAAKDPHQFLQYLRSPVEIVRDHTVKAPRMAEKYGASQRMVLSSDLRLGKILIAEIDVSRSKEEIFAALGCELDKYRGAGWGLPAANARKRAAKTSKLDLPSRRWEVWDSAVGRDLRKTAAAWFPKEYNRKNARAEVRAEAGKYLAAKGGRGRARGRDLTVYDQMLKTPATKNRLAKWKKIEDEIRRVIKSCEEMIGLHKPVISGT